MKTSVGMWQRQSRSQSTYEEEIFITLTFSQLSSANSPAVSEFHARNVPSFSCVNQQCKDIWVLINTTILQGNYYWYNSIHRTNSILGYLLSSRNQRTPTVQQEDFAVTTATPTHTAFIWWGWKNEKGSWDAEVLYLSLLNYDFFVTMAFSDITLIWIGCLKFPNVCFSVFNLSDLLQEIWDKMETTVHAEFEVIQYHHPGEDWKRDIIFCPYFLNNRNENCFTFNVMSSEQDASSMPDGSHLIAFTSFWNQEWFY